IVDGDLTGTSATSGLAMNTVAAGRGSRISVPLPASSRIGGPFAGTCDTPLGGADVVTAAVLAAGAAGGDRSSAALLPVTPSKTDPAAARTSILCITNLLMQLVMQQSPPLYHRRARS